MSALDLTAFAAKLAAGTKAHVERELAAVVGDLRQQIKALEAEVASLRAQPTPRDGRDGKDVDMLAVKTLVDAAVTAVPPVDLGPLVRDAVTAALATWPMPKDGKDGRDGVDGKDGRDGIDGKDGAPGLNGKDGAPGVMGQKGDPGPAGLPGMQGDKGLDGAPGPAGVMGEKGLDGRDGRDGLPGVPGPMGEKGLDGKDGRDGLHGKDGADGLHGKDGLGFDDLSVVFSEATGYVLKFERGDEVKAFPIAATWFAGVWQSGRKYPAGAKVLSKGAEWTARVDTFAKPGESRDWTLSAKGGRDGKDGRDAPGASRDGE